MQCAPPLIPPRAGGTKSHLLSLKRSGIRGGRYAKWVSKAPERRPTGIGRDSQFLHEPGWGAPCRIRPVSTCFLLRDLAYNTVTTAMYLNKRAGGPNPPKSWPEILAERSRKGNGPATRDWKSPRRAINADLLLAGYINQVFLVQFYSEFGRF